MGSHQNITQEDVITKLKDDGDFDRLRLKTIRLLKQNEELRNNIVSVVKQSAALNRAGAENMKPRQLCDAIHDEVREQVMSQISNSLWAVIRSPEGMKSEITETVRSVYHQLLNPHATTEGGLASTAGQMPSRKEAELNGSVMAPRQYNGIMANGEAAERASFPLQNHIGSDNGVTQPELLQPGPSDRYQEQERESHESNGGLQTEDGDHSPPPGFSSLGKRKQPSSDPDEDPELPPGFG